MNNNERLVCCMLCNHALFYKGDCQHTPEVRVTIEGDNGKKEFIAHQSCWDKLIKENTKP